MMLSLLATSFIVVCVFGTLLVTNCQSCQTSLDILVISSGFNAGNAASIELKYDATRIEYPDSWMTRGFNILVIDQSSYSIASEGHFDTYGASDEEGAETASRMLAFLQGVNDGDYVIMAAKDATDGWWWEGGKFPHIDVNLKTYMSANFANGENIDFNELGAIRTYRYGYAFIGMKSLAPLILAERISGSLSTTATASISLSCAGRPSPAPTLEICSGGVRVEATAQSFGGSTSSISFTNDDTGILAYDFTWFGRGFNVLAIDPET